MPIFTSVQARLDEGLKVNPMAAHPMALRWWKSGRKPKVVFATARRSRWWCFPVSAKWSCLPLALDIAREEPVEIEPDMGASQRKIPPQLQVPLSAALGYQNVQVDLTSGFLGILGSPRHLRIHGAPEKRTQTQAVLAVLTTQGRNMSMDHDGSSSTRFGTTERRGTPSSTGVPHTPGWSY